MEDWVETLYKKVFENRLDCKTVLEDLKRDGVAVMENVFDTKLMISIVTEIRKVVMGLGVEKVPTKVRGIIKMGLGFANETIFWYLRIVLNSFFERFLGSRLTLVSFDTMNETSDVANIVPNPHVDVLFGSEQTDALQCIFQFKIRIINKGVEPSDFQVIDGPDTNGAGFNFYKGSHDPIVRRKLMKRFPGEIVPQTWELPKNEEILKYLENDLQCKHTIIAQNNCLIIFAGTTIHHAGKSLKKERKESIFRYAVYASVQRLDQVPFSDVEKRIKWLYLSETKRGTGHQIKQPNVQTARIYEQEVESMKRLKSTYVPKVSLIEDADKKKKLVMTSFDHKIQSDRLKTFDFAAFGIKNKETFEKKITDLSGVSFWSKSFNERTTLLENESIESLFEENNLAKYNQFIGERLSSYLFPLKTTKSSTLISLKRKQNDAFPANSLANNNKKIIV